MSEKSAAVSSGGGGLGCSSVLTIVFVVLKLTGYIDWSWFWVLSPTIFSFAFFVVVIGIFVVAAWKFG
jgi:hypothetical protein